MTRIPDAGELADDIAEIKASITEMATEIKRGYIPREVFELRTQNLELRIENAEARVAAQEGRVTWAFRAAVTGLALPLIVGVIVAVLVGSFT